MRLPVEYDRPAPGCTRFFPQSAPKEIGGSPAGLPSDPPRHRCETTGHPQMARSATPSEVAGCPAPASTAVFSQGPQRHDRRDSCGCSDGSSQPVATCSLYVDERPNGERHTPTTQHTPLCLFIVHGKHGKSDAISSECDVARCVSLLVRSIRRSCTGERYPKGPHLITAQSVPGAHLVDTVAMRTGMPTNHGTRRYGNTYDCRRRSRFSLRGLNPSVSIRSTKQSTA